MQMRVSGHPKIFSVLVACLLLAVPAITSFFGQNSQPSPSPSQTPFPSPSSTPLPARSPSPTPLPGAQNFHQWGSITLFNGLPSDAVRAIAQTLDGVMWFGTDNGLARFDGRRVQNFSFGSSDANRINVLKTASSGELWIGTRAGAFVYSENAFRPVDSTQSVGITAILLGPEDYLGTDAGRVLRVKSVESGGLSAEDITSEPNADEAGRPMAITSLIDHGGQLLAGTAGRGAFIVKDGKALEFPSSPRPLFVNSLARSEAGKLWLGTDAAKGLSGIYLIEGGSRAERIVAPTANVLALEANDSGLWVGTERDGLFHVGDSKPVKNYTFENTSGGLRSDSIYTLFTDREGVIWIGTNRGVSRFDRLGAFQETVSDIPNSNFVRVLYRLWDERSYAGTNRGLFVRAESRPWTEVSGLRNRVIYAVSSRPGGQLIVGTPDGVFNLEGKKLFDGDARGFATFSHFPHADNFTQRQYAAVWGVGLVDITGRTPKTALANGSVTAVAIPVSGHRLWVGTARDGLFSFDGEEFKMVADALKFGNGAIWRMFDDGTTLFVASERGVFTYREGNVEKIIESEDVRDVFSRDGRVWAATTSKGLLNARRDDRFGWIVSSIGFEQGMPSEKAFLIRPSGEQELTIATNRGIVTYRPGTVSPKLIATRVLSQRMHDVGETRTKIELDHPQNSLLVEVAGQSSRTFPEEFQYAFLLKNDKGDVLDSRLSNDPQYAPADLKPGDYTIESIAFDRDLLSSEPLSIAFSIGRAPFPWTATALGILLAIALIALIWAIVERRRIVRSNGELAAARFDLANEAERERSRIARDLHDQTLADLRGLIMKSDRELPADAGFREEIESISTEVRRICEDLSPSVLENVGLVASLEFLLSHTIENYTFDAGEASNDDIAFPMNVQLQIYRIAQEVLTNINRHAEASVVEMALMIPRPNSFEMTIANDGKPFSPPEHNLAGGRGIAGIRSRAALINAHVEWDETPNERQSFRLTLAEPFA